MSRGLGALTAILEAADDMRAEGYIGWAESIEEAYAAFAELIEAAEESVKSDRFDSDIESWVQYSLRFYANKDRLSSAIASVRGEK